MSLSDWSWNDILVSENTGNRMGNLRYMHLCNTLMPTSNVNVYKGHQMVSYEA